MRLMLAALCLSLTLQLPVHARSAVEGVWLFDDAPSYPGVTMLEVADDAGVISGSVTTFSRWMRACSSRASKRATPICDCETRAANNA